MKITGVIMLRFLLMGFAMSFSLAHTGAQQNEVSSVQDTSFVVDAGTTLNDVIPAEHIFHYSRFIIGKVFFRDGNVREAKLNYNRLMDEMDFISETGDTLAIDNEPTIKFIVINRDTFYYDHGYVMLIKTNNGVKLGVKEGFKLGDKRKEMGYNMMGSASSASSLSLLDDGTRMYELKVKEQIVVSRISEYYIGDKFNQFLLATKKNFINLFPTCAERVKRFSKRNKIDFSNRNHLERLVSFLEYTCLKNK